MSFHPSGIDFGYRVLYFAIQQALHSSSRHNEETYQIQHITIMSNNNNSNSKTLRFEDGSVQFRQRLVISLLSHRPLLIKNIRSDNIENPGLIDYEVNFLKLIDTITNGSTIEINSTGTQLRFFPGTLLGGTDIIHKCPDTRSVGWFIEGVLPLLPFGKEPIQIMFEGVTDGLCETDPSPDYWNRSSPRLFSIFGIGADDEEEMKPQIRVIERAAAPTSGGHGKVLVSCPIVKQLQSIDLIDEGKIKRIRGNAISCKIVSSSMAARVAYSAKGVFHKLLPDVWIHTDIHTPKRNKCGPSPSMSLVVSSESTTGVILTAECCIDQEKKRGTELPEDLGQRGACMLLEEIRRGGCIDTSCQSLAFIWMALSPEEVSRIRIGTLSQYSIATLRLIKYALDVEFMVKPDLETKTVLLSCLGTGFRNMAKAST
jgi:RNA 3'-terminal phosphate cyclase-like protein